MSDPDPLLVRLNRVLDAWMERTDGNPRKADPERMAREVLEAERLHDQEPGRWGAHASPARMRRDIARDREEDRTMGTG